jgi:hypothetical protein
LPDNERRKRYWLGSPVKENVQNMRGKNYENESWAQGIKITRYLKVVTLLEFIVGDMNSYRYLGTFAAIRLKECSLPYIIR